MSGNHSAAFGDTSAKTAAGTSPPITRSSAFVCPSFSWTSAAPAAAIAVRIDALDADRRPLIATSFPARSDNDLISGRDQNGNQIARVVRRRGFRRLGIAGLGAVKPEATRLLVAAAPPVGSEAATLAGASFDTTAALSAGCRSAVLAAGDGIAGLAVRSCAAGVELSRRVAVARRTSESDERRVGCADAGCATIVEACCQDQAI